MGRSDTTIGVAAMLSYPMPFASVPCLIWLAVEGEPDAWNNRGIEYATEADIETTCVYTPGTSKPDTADDIEDGRPRGARATMTFFLPKTVVADLRDALISCQPPDDAALSGRRFKVVGEPYSYSRANTPGDYSWMVEGVEYLG